MLNNRKYVIRVISIVLIHTLITVIANLVYNNLEYISRFTKSV